MTSITTAPATGGGPRDRPGRPRLEHLSEGLGLGTATPRVSWAAPELPVERYELEVVDSVGTSWKTEVAPADRVLSAWPAAPLSSGEARTVRVRARLEDGRITEWSDFATAEAGLLTPDDWKASWAVVTDLAEGLPVLQRRFIVDDVSVPARLHLSYRGVGVVFLNGIPVGDDVLAPGWQSYGHRIEVRTHDVTGLLRSGENLLEVRLGDGWYRGRVGFTGLRALYGDELGVLVQLDAKTPRGTRTLVTTDEQWRWQPGPVTAADLYDGESHDARREHLDPTAWRQVELRPIGETLSNPSGPPVRRTEVLHPISVRVTRPGTAIVDFGVNLVGRLRIDPRLRAGETVTVRHAEVLDKGELAVRPLRTASATDRYIASDDGGVWEPSFTYHGFRYAELNGPADWDPKTAEVSAVAINSDMERIGTFATSHPLLQRLHDNVVRSTRGNFVSIPTDCPQRDERLGWTGDIAVFAPTASYLFDATGMLLSWLRDLALEQDADGLVPYFVPRVPFPPELSHDPIYHHTHTAVWGDACVLVPFALYEASGDAEILREMFPTMRRWLDGVVELADDDGVWRRGFQYGDWLDPSAPDDAPARGATDPALVATAYFAHSCRLVARAAEIIGLADEQARFAELAGAVSRGFVAEFVSADDLLTSDSQTAYALAICLDLLPHERMRAAAGRRLVDLVREAGHRIGTGFVGTPLILDALTRAGGLDDAYRLLLQTEQPSWLYPIAAHGATSVWERWNSLLPDGSINPSGMTSFNHYALGAVASWLHGTVGGLAPAEPGYRRLRIAPRPHPDIHDAATAHETPFGRASVSWRLDTDLHVEIEVPPDTTAEVDLPGVPVFEVGPGRHRYETAWPPAAAQQCPPEVQG